MNARIESPHELIVAGFGPAAIAVAAAIEDAILEGWLPESYRKKVVFLERAPRTEWQGGLLLPGTNINHSEYRDLATPRDPGSRFTFARFLKETGNLYNRGAWTGAVGRIEWSQYVTWAAKKLSHFVRYDEAVSEIDAAPGGASGELLAVSTSRGVYMARQVMIACGMERHVPDAFAGAAPDRVRHADGYLYYRNRVEAQIREKVGGPFRVSIIGSGLSAAEIMHDLLSRHAPETIDITSIHRGMAFRQYDMSQFSNGIFMPDEISRYHGASPDVRRAVFAKTFATNFSGVDAECAAAEWNFLYERKLMGIKNARILDRHEIVAARIGDDQVRLALRDVMAGETATPVAADLVILATGYRDTAPDRLLAPLGAAVRREFDGLIAVGRDYRLCTDASIRAPIWMNGHGEHTHGIADTQSFSLVAHKAECLFHSIFAGAAPSAAPLHAERAFALAADH